MIVEFAGIPRSGKSTSIDAVKDYYIRKGQIVKSLFEGARTCPFPHQFRVRTAFWTANKVQNDVIQISIKSKRNEILYLQDRGLFDAMAFIKLLEFENIAKDNEQDIYNNLVSNNGINNYLEHMANWAWCVDLVILIDSKPEIALGRDLATKMKSGPGMITNLKTLRSLDIAYKAIIKEYGKKFPRIEIVTSTKNNPLKSALKIRDLIEEIRQISKY